MSRRTPAAGFTVLEALLSAAIFAVGITGALVAMSLASRQLARARETEIANAAAARIRETLSSVRFRAVDASDTTNWLIRGGYELTRTTATTAVIDPPVGSSFIMPDLRTVSPSTVDGVGGCVVVEFPVPPLAPIVTSPPRTNAGRLILYTSEVAQPAIVPSRVPLFPFPPTSGVSGLTRLDCDVDGAATTADLRTAHGASANPCEIVPARIVIEWRSESGQTERYEEFFLLTYPGRD